MCSEPNSSVVNSNSLAFLMKPLFCLAYKQVKTVEGITELQIPPGTQPGDVLVLSKKGVPKLNKPSLRGDHLFTIKVTIPRRVRYKFFPPFPYLFLPIVPSDTNLNVCYHSFCIFIIYF